MIRININPDPNLTILSPSLFLSIPLLISPSPLSPHTHTHPLSPPILLLQLYFTHTFCILFLSHPFTSSGVHIDPHLFYGCLFHSWSSGQNRPIQVPVGTFNATKSLIRGRVFPLSCVIVLCTLMNHTCAIHLLNEVLHKGSCLFSSNQTTSFIHHLLRG